MGTAVISGVGAASVETKEFFDSSPLDLQFFDAFFDVERFFPFLVAAETFWFVRVPGTASFFSGLGSGMAGFLLAEEGLGMAVFFGVDESHHGARNGDAVGAA